MTLQEKFAALTPEQQEKFLAVENEAEFDALLKEAGIELTAEEQEGARKYMQFREGKLSDEELEDAAGGCGFLKALFQPTYNYSAYEIGLLFCPRCHSNNLKMDTASVFGKAVDMLANPFPLHTPAGYHCKNCGNSFQA